MMTVPWLEGTEPFRYDLRPRWKKAYAVEPFKTCENCLVIQSGHSAEKVYVQVDICLQGDTMPVVMEEHKELRNVSVVAMLMTEEGFSRSTEDGKAPLKDCRRGIEHRTLFCDDRSGFGQWAPMALLGYDLKGTKIPQASAMLYFEIAKLAGKGSSEHVYFIVVADNELRIQPKILGPIRLRARVNNKLRAAKRKRNESEEEEMIEGSMDVPSGVLEILNKRLAKVGQEFISHFLSLRVAAPLSLVAPATNLVRLHGSSSCTPLITPDVALTQRSSASSVVSDPRVSRQLFAADDDQSPPVMSEGVPTAEDDSTLQNPITPASDSLTASQTEFHAYDPQYTAPPQPESLPASQEITNWLDHSFNDATSQPKRDRSPCNAQFQQDETTPSVRLIDTNQIPQPGYDVMIKHENSHGGSPLDSKHGPLLQELLGVRNLLVGAQYMYTAVHSILSVALQAQPGATAIRTSLEELDHDFKEQARFFSMDTDRLNQLVQRTLNDSKTELPLDDRAFFEERIGQGKAKCISAVKRNAAAVIRALEMMESGSDS